MNTADFARQMKALPQILETEFKKSANGLGIAGTRFVKEKMTEEIYAIPVEVRPKSGKKKWKRTGFLRRSVRAELRGPYAVAIITSANYALPRHEYGRDGRTFNPLRVSHWNDELQKAFESSIPDIIDATLRDVYARMEKL